MSNKISSEILQNQYNEICRSLGDAEYKKAQLEDHITKLKSQLDSLNSIVLPIASMVEQKVNDDILEAIKSQKSKKES